MRKLMFKKHGDSEIVEINNFDPVLYEGFSHSKKAEYLYEILIGRSEKISFKFDDPESIDLIINMADKNYNGFHLFIDDGFHLFIDDSQSDIF